MVCSKQGDEAVTTTSWGKCLSFPVTCAYFPSCLWGYAPSRLMGTGMGPIPSLTFRID